MLFLALVARFPVFLEFTEMPVCYYTFPLFSTSSSSFTVRGPLWGTSGCNFACLFARSFCLLVSLANCRLFGDFLNVLFGEKNRKVRVQNNI